MTVHFAPSTACNLACNYCYQTPDRARKIGQEKVRHHYDVEKVIERLEDMKRRYPNEMPGFHGGEPLLMPIDDLKVVMEWIYENHGEGMHLQTNGTLITDEHIRLFKKYRVGVGVSLDGPPELNRQRRAANDSDRTTDAMTGRTIRNIVKLRHYGVGVGVIVVVSKENAGTPERREKLLNWIGNLNYMGVTGHFNPAIPYEDIQTDVSLSGEELLTLYLETWERLKDPESPLTFWNPMRQAMDNLLGLQLGNCVNNRCDVYNAGSAKIVLGDGETTGCGKTWDAVGDGVPFLQGDTNGSEYDDTEERYEMLKQVPMDMGGCEGCPYWNVCQGGCPSAGADFDFRNKTVFCEAVYGLYEQIEKDLRALMPAVRTVTDLPWDADVGELARCGQLDLRPFANADPRATRPSVSNRTRHPHPEPEALIPEDKRPAETFDRKLERVKKEYGSENVEYDRDTGMIHADMGEPPEETDGWEEVDDE